LFGLWILGSAIERIFNGGLPDAHTMTVIGLLAFAVNLLVAYLLYAFRNGDSNMRSVWLCSRNDALGNIAVVIAALGVFGTGTAWPDLIVASFMAGLALTSAVQVLRQARGELRQE
jgi:Co/Zn/Cd efflux system component